MTKQKSSLSDMTAGFVPWKIAPAIRICAICERDNTTLKRFQKHHVRYASEGVPELTIDLCFGCHQLIHGRACWNHPFTAIYGKDLGPYRFARKVLEVYNKAWGGGDEVDGVILITGVMFDLKKPGKSIIKKEK